MTTTTPPPPAPPPHTQASVWFSFSDRLTQPIFFSFSFFLLPIQSLALSLSLAEMEEFITNLIVHL